MLFKTETKLPKFKRISFNKGHFDLGFVPYQQKRELPVDDNKTTQDRQPVSRESTVARVEIIHDTATNDELHFFSAGRFGLFTCAQQTTKPSSFSMCIKSLQRPIVSPARCTRSFYFGGIVRFAFHHNYIFTIFGIRTKARG